MRVIRALAIALTLTALVGPQNISAQSPGTVIDLGGTGTVPIGMNDLGEVVGLSTFAGDTRSHAFLWSGGVLYDLGTLPGHTVSQARGVNNLRQVVGASAPSFTQAFRAFLWDQGVMIDLNTPATAADGWVLTVAFDINDAGQIVGWGSHNGIVQRAFLLDNGVVTDLGTLGGAQAVATAINRSGQIAGLAQAADGVRHAVTWTNGVIRDQGGNNAGASFNLANGINDFGESAGSFDTASGFIPMFWDVAGTPFALPMLGSAGQAYAINNLRQIAGTSGGAAVVWQDGSPIDLETLVPGFDLISANSINNAGQVAGQMAFGRGFLIQLPVPVSGVAALIDGLVADSGLQASLLAKINGAAAGRVAECNVLRAVSNEINAQSGKKIPADVAAQLLETIAIARADCQ